MAELINQLHESVNIYIYILYYYYYYLYRLSAGPLLLFSAFKSCRQSIVFLGLGISPSQSRYLHTGNTHKTNTRRHPYR
jgi:hypothetical protein